MAEQRTQKEPLLKRIKNARQLRGRVDFSVLLVITALCAFGLVMIFSASYYYAQHYSGANNDSFYYLKRQLIYLLLGYPVMLLVSMIDYRIIERLRTVFLAISLVLLVAVLLWGQDLNGGKRWLNIAGISIQPSELAKFGLMIFMCSYMSRHRHEMNTFRFGMLPMLIAIGAIAGLVMLQPNMSMAVIIGFIGVVLLYLGGCDLKQLIVLGVIGIVGVLVLAYAQPYRVARMTSFSNPETDPLGSGYHIIQSKIAIGSGMLFGKGIFQGTQSQLNFLPENHTDFIFGSTLARDLYCKRSRRYVWAIIGSWNIFDVGVSRFGKCRNDNRNNTCYGNTIAADELRRQCVDNRYFRHCDFAKY